MVKAKVLRSLQLIGLLLAIVFVVGCMLVASLSAASAPKVTEWNAINGRSLGYTAGVPASLNGDYLRAVSAQEGLYRWPASRLPLRVYIDDGTGVSGYRSHYSNMVAQAFDEWCQLASGKLRWSRVSDPRQADIICLWTDRPEARNGGIEAGQTVTLARQGRGASQIEAAKVTILTQLGGRAFSDADMKKTALHEVGHALGLQGHSNIQSDIMYPSVNRAQVSYLTQRDANTINRLYSGYGDAPTIAQAPTYGRQYYSPAAGYGSGYDSYAPSVGSGVNYGSGGLAPALGSRSRYGGYGPSNGYGRGRYRSYDRGGYGGAQSFGYQPMPYANDGTLANSGGSALRQMASDLARSIMQGALSR